jgi:polyhydroxyalkanoate synthesis regulator phasin
MNKNTKTKLVAGVAGALTLAVAVGAAGAYAAGRALSANDESQAVIDDAADQLGIESNELSDALKQALENRVDEAVEDGRLTEEQGAELKERIESGETPLIFPGFGHHGFGGGPHGHFGGLDAAADYLGVTEAELREQLRDGKTLAEVAEDEGKAGAGLVDAMVASAEEKIDQAVEDGRLTEERATELKQQLEERITDLVNGELRGRPFGGFGHRGFGPGGLPGGPGFRGPRA